MIKHRLIIQMWSNVTAGFVSLYKLRIWPAVSNFIGKMVVCCSSATFAMNLALNSHFLIDGRCTVWQRNLYFQTPVMDVQLK